MHIQPHSGITLFAKRSILKTFRVFWIHLCLDNCSLTCKWPCAMSCITHNQNSDIFITLFVQVYSGIFKHIQHYQGIFRLFQPYSEPFVTFAYSQLCHIPNPGIFRTAVIFKTLWNFAQAYSEPCHSQKGLFRHYLSIFRHIQRLV